VQEKEGGGASRWGQVHEVQGSAAWKKTMSRGEAGLVGRKITRCVIVLSSCRAARIIFRDKFAMGREWKMTGLD
jgi:hypothetical protein